jgi:hypothetical protein
MNKKEVKKAPVKQQAKGAPSGKGVVEKKTTSSDKKSRRNVKMYKILVKCTNGESFYTWSTCGNDNKEVSIALYSDPFIHEAWNKDKTKRVVQNNSFNSRYGNVEF